MPLHKFSCQLRRVTEHDDVIKWKHFPRYWSFVRGIRRWPVNSPHKGQWRGALMFSLICAWINRWINNREASDLRRHRVIVMTRKNICQCFWFDCLLSVVTALNNVIVNSFWSTDGMFPSNGTCMLLYCALQRCATIAGCTALLINWNGWNKVDKEHLSAKLWSVKSCA